MQFVRALGVDVDAHILQYGQRLGQRERLILAEYHEVHVPGFDPVRLVQLDRAALASLEHPVYRADVAAGIPGIGVFLVARRKDAAVHAKQFVTFVVTEGLPHLFTKLVRPAYDDLLDAAFNVVDADPGPLPRWCPHDRVQARERRVGYLDAGVDGCAVESVFQDVLDLAANGCRIAFARYEYEAGEKPPEGIAAQEKSDPLPVLEIEDTHRRPGEIRNR